MSDSRKPVITDDGNSRLTVLDQIGERDLKDYPKLTAEHLMHQSVETPIDTKVATEIDAVMSRQLRARSVGAGLFKVYFDTGNTVLMYDLYMLGERGFIEMVRRTDRPDSLAHGLTDAELGLAWDIYAMNVRRVAEAGAKWRKRKDSLG